MKLAVSADRLRASLAYCAKVTSKRSALAVYTAVLLDAGDDLTIRATDGDMIARATVEADVAIRGAVGVDAAELLRVVTAAKGANLSIETSGARLRLRWGRAHVDLPTIPAEDFPEPWGDSSLLDPVDGDLLRMAIGACAPATSTEETRYYLNGVCIRDAAAGARLYAIDGHVGHRVVLSDTRYGADDAIIPNAGVALILATSGVTQFHVSASKWGIEANGVEVWGRTIDGTFPDTDRTIPDAPLVAIADRNELINAIRVASLGSEAIVKEGRAQPIILRATNGGVEVKALGGSAKIEIDADVRTDFGVCASTHLLLATLTALDCEMVAISCGGIGHPIRIEPQQQRAEAQFTGVIMPRRATAEEIAA